MIDYEEIDAYLNGTLVGDDAVRFEEKMQNDVDLAIEVELYQAIQLEGTITQSQAAEKASLKDTLQQLNKQYFVDAPVVNMPVMPASETIKSQDADSVNRGKIKPIRKWIMLVVSVAAIFLVVLLIKNAGTLGSNTEELFTQYAAADDLNSERGDDNSTLQLTADSLFNNKNYTEAIPLLNKLITEDENGSAATEYQLALGYSYMQTNAYDKANEIFTALTTGESLYANRAKWYTALLLLKQNKKDACIAQLKTIPGTAGDYKKAQELLNKLQ